MTCWIMTTGEAGMRSQVRGLAEGLGVEYSEKIISIKKPWKWIPSQIIPLPFMILGKGKEAITPPWPDLIITCGRRSIPIALAIKKANQGKTFTIHIQDPKINPRKLDIVIPPIHDELEGENVFPTFGNLHPISQNSLSHNRSNPHRAISNLSKPIISVLIGGKSKAFTLSEENATFIASELLKYHEQGYAIALTFSNRTEEKTKLIIRNALQNQDNIYIWSGEGENPYISMLACSEYIMVTADSTSMVTEAAATGKPIYILPTEGGNRKFSLFHNMMSNAGFTRQYKGALESWDYKPMDETGRIVALLKENPEIIKRLNSQK